MSGWPYDAATFVMADGSQTKVTAYQIWLWEAPMGWKLAQQQIELHDEWGWPTGYELMVGGTHGPRHLVSYYLTTAGRWEVIRQPWATWLLSPPRQSRTG